MSTPAPAVEGEDRPFVRIWHGFLTARAMMALAIVALQLLGHALVAPMDLRLVVVAAAYLIAAVIVRARAGPHAPAPGPGPGWLPIIGVDMVAIGLLQVSTTGGLNYAPLFALPVLMAAMLGSVVLALATAAAVTLLLLADAWWQYARGVEHTAAFLQAALFGSGLFAVALLVRQLTARLERAIDAARRNELAAALQAQVSQLVIEALTDGALVVDEEGRVLAANPAARRMLGAMNPPVGTALQLADDASWTPLLNLVRLTLKSENPQRADMAIHSARRHARRLHVRTRITRAVHRAQQRALCVVFLQDLREMEARVRTEKLAAMGRMSAAVAHEIRNPLSAIVQANALLDEELDNPGHRHLAGLVRQNAQRLARIVDEVLDISRVPLRGTDQAASVVPLGALAAQSCQEWVAQGRDRRMPQLALDPQGPSVEFDAEHLRRVLVNLLDNADRYADDHADAIQVRSTPAAPGSWSLEVWSAGPALEDSVERHLFEPFFSSESRSTGLGLFICRELCERHGASIRYERGVRRTERGAQPGNAFTIVFRPPVDASGAAALAPTPDLHDHGRQSIA